VVAATAAVTAATTFVAAAVTSVGAAAVAAAFATFVVAFARPALGATGALVGSLLQEYEGAAQFVHDALHRFQIGIVFELGAQVGDEHFAARLFAGCDGFAEILDLTLDGVADAVCFVAYIGFFLALAVVRSVGFGFAHGAFDIVLRHV